MQTNPPDPESVAAGLTKAQRAILCAMPETGYALAEAVAEAAGYNWRKLKQHEWPGFALMRPTLTDPPGEFLTPLGLAVKAALQSKETK